MFSYILQVTLCWSAFYLLYLGLLRKETFFQVNRWYLLSTLTLGLLIPFLEWQPSSVIEHHPTYEIAIEPIQFQMGQLERSIEAAAQSSILDWTDICLAIYLSGMLFFTALLLHGLWKIWRLYRKGAVEIQGNIKIVYTPESHLPFSFFNCLFWSKHFEAELQEKAQILRHEEAHIYQWHTLDVLFLELLNIIFWCSPIIYFYRKSLRTTHEYLADALVLKDTKRKEYGHLLLKQSLSGIQIALANNFIHSQLKNRILMMTRNKSRKRNLMKYLPLLPILLLAILVFSKHEGRVQVEKAVASLMQVEKQPFDEEVITKQLKELASTYTTFTQEDLKDSGRFLDFAGDYKELMATYDKSEHEIADLTKAVFLQYNIVVEPSIDALTRIARISFLNSKGASGKFTLFFDDDFGLMNTEVVSVEKRLYELAKIHQQFGCCDANPEAPHEHFSADYINFLSSFGDPKEKLQVAHLTEEIFKEYNIDVGLNLVDVGGDKNYVLGEISFKTDDRVSGGSARKFTYRVNDENHHVDKWEVTFIQFMKMYLKKYERASSHEERKAAADAIQIELNRWIGLYPNREDEIRRIHSELELKSLMRRANFLQKSQQNEKDYDAILLSQNGKNGFIHPIKDQSKITKETGYGMRTHPIFKNRQLHTGVDYVVPMDTEVVATADGKVVVAKNWSKGFGVHITIDHADGYSTFYAHLEKLLVKEGQQVKQGEVIALSGSTGISTGPHLHYEIRKNGEAIDFNNTEIETTSGSLENPKYDEDLEVMVVALGNKKVIKEEILSIEEKTAEEIELLAPDVDEMPRFPSKKCESLEDMETKRNCSNQALIEYIYANIKYPAAARKAGIEGMNIVQFKVMQDGSLEDIRLLKDIGGGCGEEAKRVIEKMNADNLRWIPGKKEGKNVAVEFTIPVNFKLQGASKEKTVVQDHGEDVFKVVEQMPRFPSEECEELATETDKRKCSDNALTQYLFQNLKYPKTAKDAGVEGMCVVQFTIEKDGSVSDVEVVRDKGAGLGDESARVVHKMNEDGIRWISGVQKGRTVRVRFTLPVKFQLSGEEKQSTTPEKFDPTPESPSQKLAVTDFNIAPNPSDGNLRLRFQGIAKPIFIKVYDANGKVLFEEQVKSFDGTFDQQIEVKSSAGIHFLTIEQEGKVFVKQVVFE